MTRGLKFRIKKEEGLYYLCSENKGADQLCGYRKADLRLCFRICKKKRFSHDEAQMIDVKCLNLEQTAFTIGLCFKKMNSGANSEDTEQTAPLGAV